MPPKNDEIGRKELHNSTSDYRGVCWRRGTCMWVAEILVKGVARFLGFYEKEEDAAMAYDQAAYYIYGR
jgi:hypothetical protein